MKKEEYRVIIQREDSNLTFSSKISQFQSIFYHMHNAFIVNIVDISISKWSVNVSK